MRNANQMHSRVRQFDTVVARTSVLVRATSCIFCVNATSTTSSPASRLFVVLLSQFPSPSRLRTWTEQ